MAKYSELVAILDTDVYLQPHSPDPIYFEVMTDDCAPETLNFPQQTPLLEELWH